MVFIHAYEALDRIPSELEANCKILDEAFPAMTVDLAFLKGSFSPAVSGHGLIYRISEFSKRTFSKAR